MRNIWTIGATLAAMVLLIGVMPASQPSAARAQDAVAPPEPKVKTELHTYDVRELLNDTPQFGHAIPHHPHEVEMPRAPVFGGPDMDEDQKPRADRIAEIMDVIKNAISRDQWVPVGFTNSMEELNGTLIVSAPASDHEAIAKLLAQLAAARHRMVSVQWLAFEISTAQLHDLKERFAGGSLLLSAKNAKTLTDELETGKLKTSPVASARLVCMNNQQTWVMPTEQQSVVTDKNEKGEAIFSHVNYAGTFAIVPILTTDRAGVLCTTVVAITAGAGDDKADASAERMYNFQSTVMIPNGGGVLMTAANHKTAQAGREVVLFLQVASVQAGAGADPRNARR